MRYYYDIIILTCKFHLLHMKFCSSNPPVNSLINYSTSINKLYGYSFSNFQSAFYTSPLY